MQQSEREEWSACRALPRDESHGPPQWVVEAHEHFLEVITSQSPSFPCFFAADAERREELAYSWLEPDQVPAPWKLRRALLEFLSSRAFKTPRSGLVVYCRLASPAKPESAFWQILQYLHEHDPRPWPRHVHPEPDHSHWGYCFGGEELFVNAHSAAHTLRRSRASGADLMLVFQRSTNFAGLIGRDEPSKIQQLIRAKLAEYDAVELHPSLAISANDPACRAWKQFWLSDADGSSRRRCPLSVSKSRNTTSHGGESC